MWAGGGQIRDGTQRTCLLRQATAATLLPKTQTVDRRASVCLGGMVLKGFATGAVLEDATYPGGASPFGSSAGTQKASKVAVYGEDSTTVSPMVVARDPPSPYWQAFPWTSIVTHHYKAVAAAV